MRVLAVSPHLDDAVFSVGGTLARLVDDGHDVVVLTCFTGSVDAPTGFALACQTDKGLAPDVDYMAVRREEDRAAAAVLGVQVEHLPLLEAPHRGYESAAALFARVRDDDAADRQLLRLLVDRDADVVLGPQGRGAHVDHLLVVRALVALGLPTAWWADVPYVLRHPDAPASPDLPGGLAPLSLPADAARRADACAAYATQLGFQFGDEAGMRAALEGAGEPLLADPPAADLLRAPAVKSPRPAGDWTGRGQWQP